MNIFKWCAIVLPVGAGLAAASWTSISFWYDLKEGLIAFLGFLAASLVQVMTVTANFLQADKLLPAEARKLNDSLTKQQHYWIGLISSTILSMMCVIVGAALKGRAEGSVAFSIGHWAIHLSWYGAICFFIATGIAFVLFKMLGLFEGVLALHRLRAELVLNSSIRQAEEDGKKLQAAISLDIPGIPKDYGQLSRPE